MSILDEAFLFVLVPSPSPLTISGNDNGYSKSPNFFKIKFYLRFQWRNSINEVQRGLEKKYTLANLVRKHVRVLEEVESEYLYPFPTLILIYTHENGSYALLLRERITL